ncbi:hypothetical protein M8J76_014888 [Diaphorina citri]|nr:hypothetical protein M8J77_007099 [Diaphorina citri]KAI5711501.1 hypothetical protein M8J75_000873 [Diaphorina citri]KAI5750345.1 hypothetical protein M8J76_014888 [Diaphorina citri]KAI5756077.1 hypothetical protein M8J77_021873 [Diaphorina citri]
MSLLINLCTILTLTTLMLQAEALPQRQPLYQNPSYSESPHPVRQNYISPSLRTTRRAAKPNQPTSYSHQTAEYYRPNYQPSGQNQYYDPSYQPSNYQESYNPNPAAFKPNFDPSTFDPASFEPSYEPSSFQPTALKKAALPSKVTDHDNSESRLERQSGGGGGHDTYVDFGAHTGHHGSFGWYADFPAHKDA